ncbi:MAG: tetratricopeptide repeat protein, partial [Alphaproteobacteria bacterium]
MSVFKMWSVTMRRVSSISSSLVLSFLGLALFTEAAIAQARDSYVEQCLERDEAIVVNACTTLIESGVESDRNLAVSHFHRGRAHFRNEDFDLAIQDFDQAIGFRPGFLNAFFQRGDVYLATEQYDLALQDYDEVLRLDPADAIAFKYRGDVYLAQGNSGRALQDYDEALRLDPEDEAEAGQARA